MKNKLQLAWRILLASVREHLWWIAALVAFSFNRYGAAAICTAAAFYFKVSEIKLLLLAGLATQTNAKVETMNVAINLPEIKPVLKVTESKGADEEHF